MFGVYHVQTFNLVICNKFKIIALRKIKTFTYKSHLIESPFVKSSCQIPIVTSGTLQQQQTWRKRLQLFSHCGSFDHHALQLLNNCTFGFLDLSTDTLGILGAHPIPLKRSWKYLSNCISHAPKNLILQLQNEK